MSCFFIPLNGGESKLGLLPSKDTDILLSEVVEEVSGLFLYLRFFFDGGVFSSLGVGVLWLRLVFAMLLNVDVNMVCYVTEGNIVSSGLFEQERLLDWVFKLADQAKDIRSHNSNSPLNVVVLSIN